MQKLYQITMKLLLCLLIVCSASLAWAQDSNIGAITWNSEGNYYEIGSEAALKDLAVYVNTGTYSTSEVNTTGHDCSGLTFKLTGNIDLESPHIVIGDSYDHFFKGTFDGNNFTISNLTIDGPTSFYQGMFGYIKYPAVIQNLTLTNCNIDGLQYVGGIVAYGYPTDNQFTIIDNCHVSGTITATGTSTSSNHNYHGGIIGYSVGTTISNCTVGGTISSEASSSSSYGGIAGYAEKSRIINCENAAAISGSGNNHGGIVGYWNSYFTGDGDNPYHCTNCFNIGTVGGDTNIGSIIGSSYSISYNQIFNCFYASPCDLKPIGNRQETSSSGKYERAYSITKGSHIQSYTVTPAASHHSVLNNIDYLKAGEWTLSFTLDHPDYTFLRYECQGGTMTNLETAEGDHTLTITEEDVTINAFMSNPNAVDIDNASVAAIPDQRWRGNVTLQPTITVTYDNQTLEEGVDYTVTWGANNTTAGGGQATLTGIDDYAGTKEVCFNIVDFTLQTPGSANSANNPYLIQNEEDLEALASIVNTNARRNGYYKQTADITLTQEHTPIGIYSATYSNNYAFTGTYNGDGKQINGLTVNQDHGMGIGLFGATGYQATISNVNIVDCDIRGPRNTGGIVGYHYLHTTIENCTVTGYVGCVDPSQPNDNSCFGGILGFAGSNGANPTITNCFSAAVVVGSSFVGSIVGYVDTNTNMSNNYHSVGTTGGIGASLDTNGTDVAGKAEIVVGITAGENVTLTLPDPDYIWNEQDLYKSGVSVTLSCTPPQGKLFSEYTVNSGTIGDAGIQGVQHVLENFTEDVVISCTFVDELIDLSEATVVFSDIETFTYDNTAHYPTPTITANDVPLTEGIHYTLTYSDGTETNTTGFVNAGTYTVIATGTGSYTGSASAQFTIDPFDISGEGITVTGVRSDYGRSKTGEAIHPVPTVVCTSINNMVLVEGTDYSLSYNGGCIEPGTYAININGTSNFTGSQEVPFTIHDEYDLTVYENAQDPYFVPVYGTQCDMYYKSEFVLQQGSLSGMAGKAITSMTFYLHTPANTPWDGTFRVFLKENNYSGYTNFIGPENATIVYEGPLDGTHDLMNIVFSTPFYYKGEKDLLIGIYQTTKGNSANARFYAYYDHLSTRPWLYGYSDSSLEEITTAYHNNYAPKTTFWFKDAQPMEVAGYGESTESVGWRLIASPVTTALSPTNIAHLVDATAANYDLYLFDQSEVGAEWQNYKAHTEGFLIENGKGYLYANKNDVTVAFLGEINVEASKEVSLVYDDEAVLKGWNLIGNPFADNASLDRPYYRLNEEGSALSTQTEGAVTPMEGVFVEATEADQTAAFERQTRGTKSSDIACANIVLSNGKVLDNAIIRFDGGESLGKFYFGKQDANINIPQGNKEYAIVSIDSDALGQITTVPINFVAHVNGEYTLTFSNALNSESLILNYLHLIDNQTGADMDLLQTPSYTFEAKTIDQASRFKLVFGTNENGGGLDNENFAFISNGNLVVNGSGTLQVIDMLGRVVFHRQITSDFHLLSSEFSPSVYLLRLIDGDQIKTQKLVID